MRRLVAIGAPLLIAICCEAQENRLATNLTIKETVLASHAPDDPLYPEQDTLTSLSRFRLGLSGSPADWWNYDVAYEHRMRWVSDNAGGSTGTGVLPASGDAPYRISQLDCLIDENEDSFAWHHELDRALVALHPEWGQVILGRQAIGLGRGIIFGAVDFFAPFSPAEVDREWRRGVDAARAEYRLTATSSAEAIGAFSDSWDDSAMLARYRGYIGSIDLEFIGGKRARDKILGTVISGVLKDAEVHGELAIFDTPEDQLDGGLFGNEHLVPKLVLGSSCTFDIGDGLTVLGEYFYNGFGLDDVRDLPLVQFNPDFQERYARGDLQTLGRHTSGFQFSYPLNEEWSSSLLLLQSLQDDSGLASPSLNWNYSDSTSFIFSCFAPWGERPTNGQLRSEYGASAFSLFIQVSIYF